MQRGAGMMTRRTSERHANEVGAPPTQVVHQRDRIRRHQIRAVLRQPLGHGAPADPPTRGTCV